MFGYIYETTCLVNNKKYIGKHKSESFDEDYIGSGKLLRRAIEKYGKENFSCIILEECETEEILNEKERYWVAQNNATQDENYYNIASGGEGCGIPNRYYSPETRQKISKGNKGKKRSQEFKDNLSKITKERKLSQTYREKISESLKGHEVSLETRANISQSLKGRPAPNKGKPMSQEQKDKISETKRKQHLSAWNKGLTKETDERVRKSGEKHHLTSITNK